MKLTTAVTQAQSLKKKKDDPWKTFCQLCTDQWTDLLISYDTVLV